MNDDPPSHQAALEGVSGLRPGRLATGESQPVNSHRKDCRVVSCCYEAAAVRASPQSRQPVQKGKNHIITRPPKLVGQHGALPSICQSTTSPPPRRERPRSPARTSSRRPDQTARGERRVCPLARFDRLAYGARGKLTLGGLKGLALPSRTTCTGRTSPQRPPFLV